MKGVYSEGFLPYELGDDVRLKEGDLIYKVEDIRYIIYVKSKTSEFEVQLSLGGVEVGWYREEEIEERIMKL